MSIKKAGDSGLGGGGGCSETLSRDFRGQSTLRKLLSSKEHLEWLKINLNVAKIITVQDYKHTKLMLMEVHVYSSVNAKCQAVSI